MFNLVFNLVCNPLFLSIIKLQYNFRICNLFNCVNVILYLFLTIHLHVFLVPLISGKLFLVFHWAYSVCIHKTHANQQGKNVCVSLYDSMCKMDKVGKKMVSELVHRHTV